MATAALSAHPALEEDVVRIRVSREVRNLISEFVGEPIIPVEASPLSGESLAGLLAHVPVGATLALVATQDAPIWLLFVVGPLGIVIFGAADGVASALRFGLRAKILGWLGIPDPQSAGLGGTEAPAGEDPEAAPPDVPI